MIILLRLPAMLLRGLQVTVHAGSLESKKETSELLEEKAESNPYFLSALLTSQVNHINSMAYS